MCTKKDIRFARERFDKGLNFYKTKGIAPQTAQLRVVVPFTANNGNYKFDIRDTKAGAHVIEQLLRRNDLFVVRAMAVALMVELNAAKGTAPLYSYPVLAGDHLPAGYKGLTNTNGYAMYNGTLSMKTGQVTNFSRFPLIDFLNVPETQPVVISDGEGMVASGIAPQFNLENAMLELPEELIFAGTKEHVINMEFPSCTIAAEADCTAYAVLILEGYLYEGGTTEDCHTKPGDKIQNPYNDAF